MRQKIVNEQSFQSKSRAAAQSYIDRIEYKRAGLNPQAISIILTLIGTFILLLFFG